MRIFLLVLTLLYAHSAAAKDDVPFPELNTEVYCRDLVSKMLDKAEQQVEKEKCLADETALRRKLKPLWHLALPESQQTLVAQHYKEERHQTYVTAGRYMGQGVGTACMDGRLDCRFPAISADQLKTFPNLNSEAFCSASLPRSLGEAGRQAKMKECLDSEELLKGQLQPFWHAVGPETFKSCVPYLMNIKNHSYRILQNCSANSVGSACIFGSIECRLKS